MTRELRTQAVVSETEPGNATVAAGSASLVAILTLLVLAMPAGAQTKNSCLDCHGILPPPYEVSAQQFADDIHERKGLGCVGCHGGDPSKDDAPAAMSRAAGFRGKIKRAQIPALCANCHSDAAFMRRFRVVLPQVR